MSAVGMRTWTNDHHPEESGPWDGEPDKVQWVDPATDLDCLIVRNHSGALCGYVGVPPGHPWHGVSYDDVDVYVHGGLTFASSCQEDAPEGHGVCHIPEPDRPDDVWWLGFDCAHGGIDLIPRFLKYYRETGVPYLDPDEKYRDISYVAGQCELLAGQAHEAAVNA